MFGLKKFFKKKPLHNFITGDIILINESGKFYIKEIRILKKKVYAAQIYTINGNYKTKKIDRDDISFTIYKTFKEVNLDELKDYQVLGNVSNSDILDISNIVKILNDKKRQFELNLINSGLM